MLKKTLHVHMKNLKQSWPSVFNRKSIHSRWLTFKHKITKIMLVMSLKYTPVTQSILCQIFLMSVRTNIFFTYEWPWNKVKVIKPGMNWYTRSKVIIMQNVKNLAWTVFMKKPMIVFVKSGNTSIISLEYVRQLKIVVYSWPAWCT